jgi:hypothetical protein
LLPLLDHHDHSDSSTNYHHFLKDGCWRYLEDEEGGGIWERMESNEGTSINYLCFDLAGANSEFQTDSPSILSPTRSSSLSHISPHPLTVQMKRRRRSLQPHGDDWPPSLCKYGVNSERGAGVRVEFRFTGPSVSLSQMLSSLFIQFNLF